MPLTDLCNQLIVTSTRRTKKFLSFWLTPSQPSLRLLTPRLHPRAETSHQRSRRRRLTDKSASPTSSRGAVDAAPRAASLGQSTSRRPAFAHSTHRSLINRVLSRLTRRLTPRFAKPLSPTCAGSLNLTQTLSTDHASPQPLSRLRAPSTDESRSARPQLSRRTTLPGPPLVPRFCPLSPASNMRSRPAVTAR